MAIRIVNNTGACLEYANNREEQTIEDIVLRHIKFKVDGDKYYLALNENTSYEFAESGIKSLFRRLKFPATYKENISIPLLEQNISELIMTAPAKAEIKIRLVDKKVTGIVPNSLKILSIKEILNKLIETYKIKDMTCDGDTLALYTEPTVTKELNGINYSFGKFFKFSETWDVLMSISPYAINPETNEIVVVEHKVFNIGTTFSTKASKTLDVGTIFGSFDLFDPAFLFLLEASFTNMKATIADDNVRAKLAKKLFMLVKNQCFDKVWLDGIVRRFPLNEESFNWKDAYDIMLCVARDLRKEEYVFDAYSWESKCGNLLAYFYDKTSIETYKENSLLRLL